MNLTHVPSARRVAAILIAFDDNVEVPLSNARLSELVGVTDRSVRRAIGALSQIGAVEVRFVEQADKSCGHRRLVPKREKLQEILAGAVVPVGGAPTVLVTGQSNSGG